MKIICKKHFYKSDSSSSFIKKGELEKVSVESIDFCCSEMSEAWEDRFINFGEFDSCGLNKDSHVNIYSCKPYPEGAAWDNCPIECCPFCGVKIIKEEILVKP